MNYQNKQSIPNFCVPNTKKQPIAIINGKVINDKLGQSDKSLWTTYQSKCNDHLTPSVKNHTNKVLGVNQGNMRWSNTQGYGNIKVYTTNNNNEIMFHDNKWNRIPKLQKPTHSPGDINMAWNK